MIGEVRSLTTGGHVSSLNVPYLPRRFYGSDTQQRLSQNDTHTNQERKIEIVELF